MDRQHTAKMIEAAKKTQGVHADGYIQVAKQGDIKCVITTKAGLSRTYFWEGKTRISRHTAECILKAGAETGSPYADTAEDAIRFLARNSIYDCSEASAIPDPYVELVWKVVGLRLPITDEQPFTCIVYLPGSLTGGESGDFEEVY